MTIEALGNAQPKQVIDTVSVTRAHGVTERICEIVELDTTQDGALAFAAMDADPFRPGMNLARVVVEKHDGAADLVISAEAGIMDKPGLLHVVVGRAMEAAGVVHAELKADDSHTNLSERFLQEAGAHVVSPEEHRFAFDRSVAA